MEYKCIKLPNYSTNLPALHTCCRPLKAAHKVQNPKIISKDAEFNWKKEKRKKEALVTNFTERHKPRMRRKADRHKTGESCEQRKFLSSEGKFNCSLQQLPVRFIQINPRKLIFSD